MQEHAAHFGQCSSQSLGKLTDTHHMTSGMRYLRLGNGASCPTSCVDFLGSLDLQGHVLHCKGPPYVRRTPSRSHVDSFENVSCSYLSNTKRSVRALRCWSLGLHCNFPFPSQSTMKSKTGGTLPSLQGVVLGRGLFHRLSSAAAFGSGNRNSYVSHTSFALRLQSPAVFFSRD